MTRILVIDDSATMRRIIQGALESVPENEIFAARSAEEALDMIPRISPDVVTLDIIMTGMDGIECLSRIMSRHPVPVVMISSLTSNGAADTLTALSMGAVDFIQKPQGALTPDLEPFRSHLIAKIRTAARATIRAPKAAQQASVAPSVQPLSARSLGESRQAPPSSGATVTGATSGTALRRPIRTGFPIALIGASTGGPPVIEAILGSLPVNFAGAVLIAQHMPEGFTAAFAERLDRNLKIPVQEVSGTVQIETGQVYIGRGGTDLVLARRDNRLFACCAPSDPERPWHPSVNRLVESALNAVDPRRIVGVLATGMGDDGAQAMAEVHARGGLTLAESRDTAVVWGMPGALVERGGADRIEPSHRMGAVLAEMIR